MSSFKKMHAHPLLNHPPTLPIESMIGDVNLFFSGEMEGGKPFMSTSQQRSVAEIDIMIAGMPNRDYYSAIWTLVSCSRSIS